MELSELLIYIILIIILISLIGVLGWLLYDHNKLKEDIDNNLNTIDTTFSSHKNKDNTIISNMEDTSNILLDKIIDTSNILTSNLIMNSNLIIENQNNNSNNLLNFHNNLNKYFQFGTPEIGINENENKIYDYYTWNTTNNSDDYKILLDSELTMNNNLYMKTNSNKNIKICDDEKKNCFNIYNNGADLIINTNDNNGRIIIGEPENGLKIDLANNNLKFGNITLVDGSSGVDATTSLTAATTSLTAANEASTSANNSASAANEAATSASLAGSAAKIAADAAKIAASATNDAKLVATAELLAAGATSLKEKTTLTQVEG